MSKHVRRQLHLDPTLCDAHGFCAELLPELIDLDEWGYPVFVAGGLVTDIPEGSAGEAKRAVAACPVGALRLTKHA
jgi:ferredoxin